MKIEGESIDKLIPHENLQKLTRWLLRFLNIVVEEKSIRGDITKKYKAIAETCESAEDLKREMENTFKECVDEGVDAITVVIWNAFSKRFDELFSERRIQPSDFGEIKQPEILNATVVNFDLHHGEKTLQIQIAKWDNENSWKLKS